ncbi:nuclear transport factor 2 family protein [Sneathiella marina]|uniref:Nuclear transport factor 2 family protein n=1 Tax=Sneathiella marina TaxID=2950108 RepID=A0ABY4VZW4_9PROT|nr:nuclear transport factor 2 family protein [Sneathiella marina]USG60232.1 nuclear transport factor 2 family protein [Sneathiella marina]
MTEEDLILDTLEEYAKAYCAKDLNRLMAIFVEGQGISLIGTGSDELCSGREAVAAVFERNFRDATASRFEWAWKDIAIHGNAAIVAIALNIHLKINDGTAIVPLRWTVSLIATNAGWKWVHRHASAAANSQEEGSAYPSLKN